MHKENGLCTSSAPTQSLPALLPVTTIRCYNYGMLPKACSFRAHHCTKSKTPSNASLEIWDVGAGQESPDTVLLL